MEILGIETSCDETAVAVVEDGKTVLASAMATSVDMHAKTGGIIPEQAAREQVQAIIPTIDECLKDLASKTGSKDFDVIAVTQGPGLIGSLLIGVETAKSLAWTWNKPLVPVNHLVGHIYANFIDNDSPPAFPFITLVVSGGHTDLMLVKNHGDMVWLGGTRDDAAGEAFDKVARLLGLPYPGGPAIQNAAENGDPRSFAVPRPMIGSGDYDFSFSGIKTAMRTLVQNQEPGASNLESRDDKTHQPNVSDLAASFQEAVVDVLVRKTLKAVKEYNAKALLLSGGVAANKPLRDRLASTSPVPFHCPDIKYCTDNGAMIAAAAFFNYKPVSWEEVQADPSLSLENLQQ